MNTWKCPTCGATNPAPINSRPEITCAACAESFEAEFINKSTKPTPISNSTKFDSKEKILNQITVKIII
jgi:hypothetical protein